MKRVKRRPNRSPVLKKFERTPHHSRTVIIAPEVEEVFLPPKEREREEPEDPAYYQHPNPFSRGHKSHRSTYYRPSNEDFGGLTELALPPNDHYQNLFQEICTDEPGTTKPELKNACEGAIVQTRSAFVEPASGLKLDENEMADLVGENQWQTIDSISDVDYFLPRVPSSEPRVETPVEMPKDNNSVPSIETRIQISNTPRIKRIAEKYSKFKRENVEVRKLEERVVCLEYDIFNLNAADPAVPIQKMRAFFCIKMKDFGEGNSKGAIPLIPSGVKRNFKLEDKDLQKMNKKEIEIIDDEIPENRSLLEDLKRVLRRKQALENKKKQPTLDLMCLYEMAKRESPPKNSDFSNTNLLSKAELQEIKDLIMKKCDSSVHGINRRTVKLSSVDTANDAPCILSSSLINELMREAQEV